MHVCVFPKQEEILILNPLAGIYGTKDLGTFKVFPLKPEETQKNPYTLCCLKLG